MKFLSINFGYFNLSHLLYLLLPVAFTICMYFFIFKKAHKEKKVIFFMLSILNAILFLLLMITKLVFIKTTSFIDELPLSLMGLFTILLPFAVYRLDRDMLGVSYFIGTFVCFINLLFPTSQFLSLSWFSAPIIIYFIYLSIQIAICINIMLCKVYTIEKKQIPEYILMTIFSVSVLHIFNILVRFSFLSFNTNYCYTFYQEGNILYFLLHKIIPFPFIYLLPLLLILIGVDYLLALPEILKKKKAIKIESIEGIKKLNEIKNTEEIEPQNKINRVSIKPTKVYKIRDDDKFL